jgi:RNA-binding protein
MDRKALRDKARNIRPLLRIGKSGLTEGVIKEMKAQLKKKKLLKIKLLKSALGNNEKKELFDEIIAKTNAELISKIGNVITIHKG